MGTRNEMFNTSYGENIGIRKIQMEKFRKEFNMRQSFDAQNIDMNSNEDLFNQ